MSNEKLHDSILIPRRLEERDQDRLQSIYRLLQKTHIESDLDLRNIKITNLGNLTSVGGSLILSYTPIMNLSNLTSVEGEIWLFDTPISRLSKRERDKMLSKVKVEGKTYLGKTT